MRNSKLNIGLYVSDFNDNFTCSVCKGAVAAAADINANLIIFPGMYLNANYNDLMQSPYYYQYNTVYDIGSYKNLDVLIIMTGNIGNTLTEDEIVVFLKKFPNIPIITMSSEYENYHSIKFDNKTGLNKAINHIIHKHNCRKIGFVSGSKLNFDAVERLNVYFQTLLDNNLPIDHNLIVYGNFSEFCELEVQQLINENPDLDAICFANDEMAKGGYNILSKSKYTVGKNIAVIGFDNTHTAIDLSPALTTVKADSFDLGYQSVKFASTIKGKTEVQRITVPTTLIIRNSCGCKNTSSEKLSYIFADSKIHKNQVGSLTIDDYMMYLFGSDDHPLLSHYFTKDAYNSIKVCFRNFFEALLNYTNSVKSKQAKKAIISALSDVIQTGALKIISYDTIFNIIDAICCKISIESNGEAGIIFSQIYREISTYYKVNDSHLLKQIHNKDSIINSIVNDVIITGETNDKAFYPVMKRLSSIGFKRSYLLLFESPVMHNDNSPWTPPDTIYLKFSQTNDNIKYYTHNPRIQISDLFRSNYISAPDSSSLVINPLFSNEELYGILICDITPELYKFMDKAAVQVSTAIKYSNLLNKWHTMLISEKENNKNLEQISKHDELTGVYNRRGYFDNAQSIISNPANAGKNAVVVFADMDNLKVINDKFGHDDGDYSLKTIANILLRSFRTTDIVGRIGGDEFAVFALLGNAENLNLITNRINMTTENFNNACDKPYYINMSLGIYPFVCDQSIQLSDILENADMLLYKQKKNKRKNVLKT